MKYILGSFLGLFLLASCAKENSSYNFKLKGYVKGLKKGTVYLQKLQDSMIITLDSLEVKGDPNFELHTNLEEPEVLVLKLDKNDNQEDRISFFADTGVTEIRSTRKLFNYNAKINGSKQQDVLEEYLSTLTKLNNRNLDKLQSNFDSKNETTFSEQQINFVKQKYTYTIQFALNNSNSEVAPYLALYEIPNTTLHFLDTIYSNLTPKIKSSKYGKLLMSKIALRKASDN